MLETSAPGVARWARKRGRERTVAALAVESDIVGLGRESDEESGKLADTRESGRRHGHSGAGERIVAARVKKDECTPLPFPSSASTASSATIRVERSSTLRSSAPTGTR